jgi:hypothetical protein
LGRVGRRTPRYLEKRRFEDTVARGGLEMHFRSWAYPLQDDYVAALELSAIRTSRGGP